MKTIGFLVALIAVLVALFGASVRGRPTRGVLASTLLLSLLLILATVMTGLFNGNSIRDIVLLRADLAPSAPVSLGVGLGLLIGSLLLLPFARRDEDPTRRLSSALLEDESTRSNRTTAVERNPVASLPEQDRSS